MARIAVLLLGLWAIAGLSSAFVPIENFETFKTVFGKTYHEEEESARSKIFEENLRLIHKHNAENHSFTLAMNHFGDLTSEEFAKFYLSKTRPSTGSGSRFLIPSHLSVPKSVDWREHGYVTPVKNQGHCGSCWTFSTTGSLEGQHFKKTGKLISLSEQQLVDCAGGVWGNNGCNGGLMDLAFTYIKKMGIEPESVYPYTSGMSQKNGTCRYDKSEVAAHVTGFTDIPKGSEEHLTASLAAVGPISIAIDASQTSFQFYQSGVYVEPQCSSTALDHGVLAVGYGTEDGADYYLVKNSWGESWGLNGYIKMARNKKNQCGVATQASYPLV